MPLTAKGSEILSEMTKEYGEKKGKEVFYASKNKGTISGVDSESRSDKINAICSKMDELGKRCDKLFHHGAGAGDSSKDSIYRGVHRSSRRREFKNIIGKVV